MRNVPLPSLPKRRIVTAGSAWQPNSSVGPIFRLQWTPAQAPVSSRASEQAAVPQCQKVIVFPLRSSAAGSPKKAGLPVICHLGAGTIARSGHYVLLRALSPDGAARINDPASEENTGAVWQIETILSETRRDAPFMILRRAAQ